MNSDRDGLEPTLTRDGMAPGDDQVDRATVLIDDDSTRVVSGLFCPICGGHFPGGLSNCTSDGTPLLPVGTGDDLSGTVLREKYVLVKLIGEGGFARVYRATHRMAKAEVAVKVIREEMRENQKARRQFLKEARASMRIQSRYAVAVHDVDEDEAGRMYIVMELLNGMNLEEHMKLVAPETCRLKWDATARIVTEICDALEEAHDKGVVHRDMKPANVMMVPGRLGKIQAKVVDFGIASLIQMGDSDLTSMDNIPKVIGTPSFMSPEQARGLSVTHKSDIYSLGAMMYRMVTGSKPFVAKTDQGMLIAHVTEPPPSIRSKFPELDVPAAFDALVMRMMAKKPEDRPADAAEVADSLKAMLPQTGAAGGKDAAGPSRSRRVMLPVAIVAAALLVAAGVGVWHVFGDYVRTEAISDVGAGADVIAPVAQPPIPAEPVAAGTFGAIGVSATASKPAPSGPDLVTVTRTGMTGQPVKTESVSAALPVSADAAAKKMSRSRVTTTSGIVGGTVSGGSPVPGTGGSQDDQVDVVVVDGGARDPREAVPQTPAKPSISEQSERITKTDIEILDGLGRSSSPGSVNEPEKVDEDDEQEEKTVPTRKDGIEKRADEAFGELGN